MINLAIACLLTFGSFYYDGSSDIKQSLIIIVIEIHIAASIIEYKMGIKRRG